MPAADIGHNLPDPVLFPDNIARDHARQRGRIAVRLPLLEPSGVGSAGIMLDGDGLVPRLHEHHVEDLASDTPVAFSERVDVLECLRGVALRWTRARRRLYADRCVACRTAMYAMTANSVCKHRPKWVCSALFLDRGVASPLML